MYQIEDMTDGGNEEYSVYCDEGMFRVEFTDKEVFVTEVIEDKIHPLNDDELTKNIVHAVYEYRREQ